LNERYKENLPKFSELPAVSSSFLQIGLEIYQTLQNRVARWYILRPKIAIWVNFGGFCYVRCWNILLTFDIFNGNLVRFVVILVYVFPILVYFIRKIWQPCYKTGKESSSSAHSE
jgi:hypothetical protein